jgi:AcrR family transcriptional regulator
VAKQPKSPTKLASSSKERNQATPRPRTRRQPAQAKELILAAATKLIAAHGPGSVGLKDVAREAGVSHALVTHYFGTIDGLIDHALEARAEKNREELTKRILGRLDEGPRAWLEQWFGFVMDSEAGRLLAWSFLTGRIQRDDFSRRTRGGAKMVAVLSERFRAADGTLAFSREDLEFVLLLVTSSSFGYAIGREGLWSSLGVDRPGPEQDRFFFDRLADLVERTAQERLGPPPEKPKGARRKPG